MIMGQQNDKTVDTNVRKIYESEWSKQASNIVHFIHIPKLLFSLKITLILVIKIRTEKLIYLNCSFCMIFKSLLHKYDYTVH